MHNKKQKGNYVFGFIMLMLVLIIIEALGYAGLWFHSREFDFVSNRKYFNLRAMLMGNTNAEVLPRYLSLPYLGYVPYPGYKSKGIVQHNTDGYRGAQVPVARNGKYRVLCMGGSTTYGYGVDTPAHTYPAQLEILLNDYILKDSALSKKYSGAEVINAGLEAGTSAEELQQYLFKYRYYKPDAVVVHSGINDALVCASSGDDFQLDYTHYRRINFHLEPLPQPARFMMHSYFFSFVAIRLFYSNFSVIRDEFMQQTPHTFCRWAKVHTDSVVMKQNWEQYPFYQNTQTLFSKIVEDSVQLFVLPNILNEKSEITDTSDAYFKLSRLNALLSKELGVAAGGRVIAIDDSAAVFQNYWLDDCHLNKSGEKIKAAIALPYVLPK